MTNTLDSFETQLLGELRDLVAARSVSTGPALGVGADSFSRFPWGRRRRRLVSLLAMTGATAAALTVPWLGGSPAFAVTEGPNGTIEVKVNRLEEARGLEAALRDLGVKADIEYLGSNLQCAAPRFSGATSVPGSATRFSIGEGIELTLDRRDIAHGETVVIAASRINDGVYDEVGIAVGPVTPCHPKSRPADLL